MGNMHLVTGYAGKEHITAADHGALHSAVFGTGQYVLSKGNQLSASVITNNQIRIADGDIMMQGRHIRLNEGTNVDLTIENGTQGKKRNDLIVARYTKDSATGVEDCNLVVIKGEAVESNPADPAYTSGDIIEDHAILNDMPLYRVPLDGLNVGNLVPLFTVYEGGKAMAFTVKLLATNWADNNQTITNDLFVADGFAYTVTPSPDSFKAYGEAMIYAQDITTDGRCKFVCENVPTVDLTVNILRNGVSA